MPNSLLPIALLILLVSGAAPFANAETHRRELEHCGT